MEKVNFLKEKDTNLRAVKMSITLNTYLRNELDSVCDELGKSKSGLIAEALEYYLDFIDLSLAESRLKEKSKFISMNDMERLINELPDWVARKGF